MSCERIARCRSCRSNGLRDVLDLGEQPLANGLKKSKEEPDRRFSLTLAVCESCRLVQLRETVDKKVLFDRYFWVTGTSSSARRFAQTFRDRAAKTAGLKAGDLVLEIASNDGTFLKPFADNGFKIHGIDPAQNIVQEAERAGIPTWARYWDAAVAEEFVAKVGRPRLVFGRNVVAHVQDLEGFLEGFRRVLAEGGTGALEYHSAASILEGLHYDAIYHEHLCYFGLRSLTAVLERFGLHAFHADPSPISGGATVVYFGATPRPPSRELSELRGREARSGIEEPGSWVEFGRRCVGHRNASRRWLEAYRSRVVVGFGASARSSTYLNYCGVGAERVRAVIDNNPLKQGLFSPGGAIPIVSKEVGLALQPELVFLLAWNFKDEIMAECRSAGYRGEYLVPFPKAPYLARASDSGVST